MPTYGTYSESDIISFIGSLRKKNCAKPPAREAVKFICKTRYFLSYVPSLAGIMSHFLRFHWCSNDDTFYNIDFYNSSSVDQLNSNFPMAFVVHGFLGRCANSWPEELSKVWTEVESLNVCCVDWTIWSQCYYLNCAQDFAYLVGEYLTEILLLTKADYGLQTRILVGHSVGAHVIGEASKVRVPECYCEFVIFPFWVFVIDFLLCSNRCGSSSLH